MVEILGLVISKHLLVVLMWIKEDEMLFLFPLARLSVCVCVSVKSIRLIGRL